MVDYETCLQFFMIFDFRTNVLICFQNQYILYINDPLASSEHQVSLI